MSNDNSHASQVLKHLRSIEEDESAPEDSRQKARKRRQELEEEMDDG